MTTDNPTRPPAGETTDQCVARLIREHGPPPKRVADLVRSLRTQALAKRRRSA